MMWRNGTVIALGQEWDGTLQCTVRLDDETEIKALAYTEMTGRPVLGARAILSAATFLHNLGTGGYMMIVAFPDNLPPDPLPRPGHIVKARYTPLQFMTMGVDEQESPWHDILHDADSIEGMPVVVADLHSALPAVVAAIRARYTDARIAYVMDDGAALPAWFSRSAAQLYQTHQILGTISVGQAFGGQLEAVTIHTGLLAARHVWNADVAIVSQGPGNLGTDTRWGYSGARVGDIINAVNTLDGTAIALLRMSNADKRERHWGLSHHTTTALTRVSLSPALCPVPIFDSGELSEHIDAAMRLRLEDQLSELFRCSRLTRHDVSVEGLEEAFSSSPVPFTTMGRGLKEDPLSFLAAGVAGYAAADFMLPKH